MNKKSRNVVTDKKTIIPTQKDSNFFAIQGLRENATCGQKSPISPLCKKKLYLYEYLKTASLVWKSVSNMICTGKEVTKYRLATYIKDIFWFNII